MGKTSHEKTYVDFEQPYERNIIGLRGIIYFGVGLFLLVIITFGLMWFLQDVMEQQAASNDEQSRNPMMMNERERLPPEPRLQAAPGFGIDTENGRVNLELKKPQAEWEVLKAEWDRLREKGQKANGTVVSLPIEEAQAKFLEEQGKKPANPGQNPNVLDESRMIFSNSNSGRLANARRR